MTNKQNAKNPSKQKGKASVNSVTNETYNGMGNCTSSVAKQQADKNAQAKKNDATDCSH